MMISLIRGAAASKTPITISRSGISTLEPLVSTSVSHKNVRWFSSSHDPPPPPSRSSSTKPFRPRRRPSKNYRPLVPRYVKVKGPIDPLTTENPLNKNVVIGANEEGSDDPLEANYGSLAAAAIRHTRKERDERGGQPLSVEEQIRLIDYVTAEVGTTEDLVGERRALALAAWDEEDRSKFKKALDDFVEEQRIQQMGLEGITKDDDEEETKQDQEPQFLSTGNEEDEQGEERDPNQLAFGEWGECVVRVDRVQKVQKGGTMVRYRALVIGGNTNGCAGFGIGKANSPKEATEVASRMCKRNIFFIDRYQGAGLTRDLAGRHNSCKVILRALPPNRGLWGHPLICDIMAFFGIADCSSKSHGNRNVYNVVRATFKAILTHESMEEIAMKRGKRLLNLERAKQLQI